MGVIALRLANNPALSIPGGESRSIIINNGSNTQADKLASFDFQFNGTDDTAARLLVELFYSPTSFGTDEDTTGVGGSFLSTNVQRGKTIFPNNAATFVATTSTQPDFSAMYRLKSWYVDPTGALEWKAQRGREYMADHGDGNTAHWAWKVSNPGIVAVGFKFNAEAIINDYKWW